MNDLNFSNVQLDALREIGNIGAGNAASALGQLLDKTVMIDLPLVKLLNLDETGWRFENFKGPEDIRVAFYFKILGELKGGALVVFSKKDSLLMSDVLLRKTPGETVQLSSLEMSSISETSYIFCCSYLNAIGDLLNIQQLIPSLPSLAVDNAAGEPLYNKDGEGSNYLLKKFVGQDINRIISIENNVTIEHITINLFVTLLLEHESVHKTLNMLGMC